MALLNPHPKVTPISPPPKGHGYLHKSENRLKVGGMDLKIWLLNLG